MRDWVKLYSSLLDKPWTLEEAGGFIKLLLLASEHKGRAYISERRGEHIRYPFSVLAMELGTTPEKLQAVLQRLVETDSIELLPDLPDAEDVEVVIRNWSKYQSEWNRIKHYASQEPVGGKRGRPRKSPTTEGDENSPTKEPTPIEYRDKNIESRREVDGRGEDDEPASGGDDNGPREYDEGQTPEFDRFYQVIGFVSANLRPRDAAYDLWRHLADEYKSETIRAELERCRAYYADEPETWTASKPLWRIRNWFDPRKVKPDVVKPSLVMVPEMPRYQWANPF